MPPFAATGGTRMRKIMNEQFPRMGAFIFGRVTHELMGQ
jgi:hypothetical protein